MRWISVSKQTDLKKKLVGEKAVKYIKDGMTIGLGSGSTEYLRFLVMQWDLE